MTLAQQILQNVERDLPRRREQVNLEILLFWAYSNYILGVEDPELRKMLKPDEILMEEVRERWLYER